ncbi:unnamed protein product [Protopolystoma xenopodis]|uniref:Uncharacterized protein n=1 Tax=Protopolystoma xenopodis TaxID=117903 RepID=A0A448XM11_9PLAT|nr:unnamed protein product [Protopolystoma xenopodis]
MTTLQVRSIRKFLRATRLAAFTRLVVNVAGYLRPSLIASGYNALRQASPSDLLFGLLGLQIGLIIGLLRLSWAGLCLLVRLFIAMASTSTSSSIHSSSPFDGRHSSSPLGFTAGAQTAAGMSGLGGVGVCGAPAGANPPGGLGTSGTGSVAGTGLIGQVSGITTLPSIGVMTGGLMSTGTGGLSSAGSGEIGLSASGVSGAAASSTAGGTCIGSSGVAMATSTSGAVMTAAGGALLPPSDAASAASAVGHRSATASRLEILCRPAFASLMERRVSGELPNTLQASFHYGRMELAIVCFLFYYFCHHHLHIQ